MQYLPYVILLAALLIVAVTDIISHKIPNVITFPLMLVGLLLCVMQGRWMNVLERLFVCILLFLFGSLRLIGLGDIKMVMMSVCLIGGMDSIYLMLAALILLLLFCLFTVPRETLVMLRDTACFLVYHIPIPKRTTKAYPFAVPYAVIYVIFFVWLICCLEF